MDKVTFTGFKNLSYDKCLYGGNSVNSVIQRFMNVELTDDACGRDLKKLKDLIFKYKKERNINLTNPLNPNFLNIFYFKTKEYGKRAFSMNGIVLPVNRVTLPIYDFIANITKRISETPDELIRVDDVYIKSDKAPFALLIKENIAGHTENILNATLEDYHNVARAKKGAKNINNGIANVMMKYFEIQYEKVAR